MIKSLVLIASSCESKRRQAGFRGNGVPGLTKLPGEGLDLCGGIRRPEQSDRPHQEFDRSSECGSENRRQRTRPAHQPAPQPTPTHKPTLSSHWGPLSDETVKPENNHWREPVQKRVVGRTRSGGTCAAGFFYAYRTVALLWPAGSDDARPLNCLRNRLK